MNSQAGVKRASGLKDDEDKLRPTMPEHVRQLVVDKRLVLWKEILSDCGYPDTVLIDDIAGGFRLSGWMPKSHVFKPRSKPPVMSLETLKGLLKASNSSTLRNMESRQEPELESATWNETNEEVSKGWVWFDNDESLKGPKNHRKALRRQAVQQNKGDR